MDHSFKISLVVIWPNKKKKKTTESDCKISLGCLLTVMANWDIIIKYSMDIIIIISSTWGKTKNKTSWRCIQVCPSSTTSMILTYPTIHPNKWDYSFKMETMNSRQDMVDRQKLSVQICRFTSAEIIKTRHWCKKWIWPSTDPWACRIR